MTAAALTAGRAVAVPRTQERIVTGLFFASLFVGDVREGALERRRATSGSTTSRRSCSSIAYVATERRPLPRTSAIVLGFFAAFALVYLAGFWNIDTQQGLTQFEKGMAKFVIHFAFLVAAIGYLAQRGERFFWRALGWFTVGFVANAVYGILQLGSAARRATASTTSCSTRSRAARPASTSTARSAARTSTGSTRSPATRTTSA